MTTHVSDANFGEEVLNSKEPVLVDFWAEWCGPCRAIAPVLDELSSELAGKVKIVKLNVDDNPGTASKYGVRSIPLFCISRSGIVTPATGYLSLCECEAGDVLVP